MSKFFANLFLFFYFLENKLLGREFLDEGEEVHVIVKSFSENTVFYHGNFLVRI